MQAGDKVKIELPLYVWMVVHTLAFKAPTTGAEAALPLTKFHEALLAATSDTSENSIPGKAQ